MENTATFQTGEGIYLKDSNYNNIHDNTAKNNSYGLRLEDSSYNCIYGNTLVNNTIQDYNETGTCIGNGDCRPGPGGLVAGDDDDDDDDDDDAIPFGNYYLLFAVIAIASLTIIYKRKTILSKR